MTCFQFLIIKSFIDSLVQKVLLIMSILESAFGATGVQNIISTSVLACAGRDREKSVLNGLMTFTFNF